MLASLTWRHPYPGYGAPPSGRSLIYCAYCCRPDADILICKRMKVVSSSRPSEEFCVHRQPQWLIWNLQLQLCVQGGNLLVVNPISACTRSIQCQAALQTVVTVRGVCSGTIWDLATLVSPVLRFPDKWLSRS